MKKERSSGSPRRQAGMEPLRGRNAEEGNAHRAGRRPRAARRQGDHRADHAGGGVEDRRCEQGQAVVLAAKSHYPLRGNDQYWKLC